jgi:hypothetical protein
MSRFRSAGFRNGRTAGRRASGRIAGGLHGGGAPHFAMGGPHRGGPHGTPLRLRTLRTRSRHGRRAPRGAPLHGGRQRQIRARCHRTVLAYWKFESISLQRRVNNFRFRSRFPRILKTRRGMNSSETRKKTALSRSDRIGARADACQNGGVLTRRPYSDFSDRRP